MASLPLKYRPDYFDEVAGNAHAIEQVESILKRKIEDIPKSWLFSGSSGTGKTTMVRIIRKELEISDEDFHEYNSSNTRGIDTIRDIGAHARMSPMNGQCKMFLLDECHQLTKDAMNALLKVLEDTPINTFFMLATTNPEKLLKAIKTRCTTITMKDLTRVEVANLCTSIADKEGIDLSKKVASAIGNVADGSAREALKILDQIIDIEDEEKALEAIEKTLGDESEVIALCRELLSNPRWKNIAALLSTLDQDPEAARRQILSYFNSILMKQDSLQSAIIIEQFLNPFYESGKAGLTLACYTAVNELNNLK